MITNQLQNHGYSNLIQSLFLVIKYYDTEITATTKTILLIYYNI